MFKKFNSFTISWHFQMIFASESYILFTLSDKNQKLCKSAQTSSKNPGYQWYFKKWYPGSNPIIYFCLPIQKSDTLPQSTRGDGVRVTSSESITSFSHLWCVVLCMLHLSFSLTTVDVDEDIDYILKLFRSIHFDYFILDSLIEFSVVLQY